MIREITIDEQAPIILLAVARSGSSLLRSLLTTHPEVRLLESTLIGSIIKTYPALSNPKQTPSAALLTQAHRSIIQAFHNASMEDPDMGILHKKRVTRWGFTVHQIEDPMTLTLLNVGFPNAKWIHLVRDGRAVAASWVENWKLATGETTEPNLKKALHSWAQSVQNVENGPPHHRIKLEDLTSMKKRRSTFDNLMKHLELDISPRQEAFLDSWPAINTSRTSKNLSKRSFSDAQRSVFQESPDLENALDFFGYPDLSDLKQQ